ncbi:hypothetical protein F4819DRAFT_490183 [Hypoxylon fuscum]|nr:hypothetical protein F4819DRAFT_490183 [Hypoxylon fuscum]
MPVETTITTPLPAGCQPVGVLAYLHDHQAYIRITCPQIISHRRLSGPTISVVVPNDEPCAFEVTDRRPTGQTTYKLTLTNKPDGIDSLVEGKAPTGTMAIKTRWRVRSDAEAGNVLDEEVEIDSNMITKKIIKSNIEKGHPVYHQTFVAEAVKWSNSVAGLDERA